MKDLLVKIHDLKPLRFTHKEINDNDSLIDMNLDDSGYFTNTIPTENFLKSTNITYRIK
jgi:hypothetical protein